MGFRLSSAYGVSHLRSNLVPIIPPMPCARLGEGERGRESREKFFLDFPPLPVPHSKLNKIDYADCTKVGLGGIGVVFGYCSNVVA